MFDDLVQRVLVLQYYVVLLFDSMQMPDRGIGHRLENLLAIEPKLYALARRARKRHRLIRQKPERLEIRVLL